MRKLLFVLLFVVPLIAAENIAVFKLSPRNVSDEDAAVITERLQYELFKLNKFNIIERHEIKKILTEQGFQVSGAVNEKDVVKIGKIAGIKKAIIGNFGKAGEFYFIALKLVDIETASIIANDYVDINGSMYDCVSGGVKKSLNRLLGIEKQIDDYNEIKRPDVKPVEYHMHKHKHEHDIHINANKAIQTATKRVFVVCDECGGKGKIIKIKNGKAVEERCPKCYNLNKYAGKETGYKYLTGNFHEIRIK